ncbi:phage terminase small subunit, partial [Escherichia coli]
DYQPWIDGVLAADTGQADEVITTVMIWAADAGDIAQALRIGQYVLRHKIPMPDQYKRTTATVLVE